MAQQTAVQMLLRYIKQHGLDLEYEMEMSFLDHEKEQIIIAYDKGYVDGYPDNGKVGLDYYKEIYESSDQYPVKTC